MTKLKIIQIGNSLGVILPKELLDRMKLKKGDEILATESPSGYRLTANTENFESQMQAAEKIMHKNHDVLRELAK